MSLELLEKIRKAFDSDNVAKKNVMLRKASDEIVRLKRELEIERSTTEVINKGMRVA